MHLRKMHLLRQKMTKTVLDEWSKDKKEDVTKTEQKLHASVGSSSFIHDRHFITTDGKITAHNPKSHEEQVKGIGHKDLSSFMKQTGAARVTHNDKTNEFSVHSHTPYTDSQTSTIRNHIRQNKIDPKSVIHDNYHDKGPGETGAAHTHNSAMFPKGNHTNMSDDVLSDVDKTKDPQAPKLNMPKRVPKTCRSMHYDAVCWNDDESQHPNDGNTIKNDRAMAGVNAEDGVNGKMRLDNDEPAESFDKDITEKSINIADPGHGSGGIRVGGAYDNSQQGTGQKDDPRVEEQENYSGEEDRGPKQKEPKYSGESDTVTGTSNENYNKSVLDLLKIQFDLKKRI